MQSLIQQLRNWPTKPNEAHAELETLLSKLIPLFIKAAVKTQSQVRLAAASVRKMENHFRIHSAIRTYAARVATSLYRNPDDDKYAEAIANSTRGKFPIVARDNNELFRLGLGALAIEDCADYRESMTTLAELCIRGEKAGVKPGDHLEELASLFSDTRIGGFGNPERPYKAIVRDFRKTR